MPDPRVSTWPPVGCRSTGAVGELGDPCPDKGLLACQGNASPSQLICGADLTWATNGTCSGDTLCDTTPGIGQGTCKPIVPACKGKSCGDVGCDGQARVTCGPDLVTTETLDTCQSQACLDGACLGECAPAQTRCAGNVQQSCGPGGTWQDAMTCAVQTQQCVSGGCVAAPPSCAGKPATCGPTGDESRCAIVAIPGGTYNRSNDPDYPATVADFRLDRFEITVGRFRTFVNAYPTSKPGPNAGNHPPGESLPQPRRPVREDPVIRRPNRAPAGASPRSGRVPRPSTIPGPEAVTRSRARGAGRDR